MNHGDLSPGLFGSSHWRCSVKKGVFKKFTNFTRKQLCWSLFSVKLQAFSPATLLKKTPTLVFSSEIFKILKNIYCEEHLRKTASICFTSKILQQIVVASLDCTTPCQNIKYFFKHNNSIKCSHVMSLPCPLERSLPCPIEIVQCRGEISPSVKSP